MSLLPYVIDDSNWWRPSRLLDQQFGQLLDPEDFFRPQTIPKSLLRSPAGYVRSWRSAASEQDDGSTVCCDKNKFQANLDVQQFRPDELWVRQTGERTITIEGKHEEKQDEHGLIFRHFIRKYTLPEDCDMGRVESKLSTDGVLSIRVPRHCEKGIEHKTIPITQTGEAAKVLEKKSEKSLEAPKE